jgi:hypothetical protein
MTAERIGLAHVDVATSTASPILFAFAFRDQAAEIPRPFESRGFVNVGFAFRR